MSLPTICSLVLRFCHNRKPMHENVMTRSIKKQGGAGDARHIVMLGQPIAIVTARFRMAREV